jgi:cellulose binding protein with CBM10 domain
MMNWRQYASVFCFASASMTVACGDIEIDLRAAQDDAAADDAEYVTDEYGTVLGTSWQQLSYPYCMSAWSDPDGDGWGWEYGRSCVVYKAPAPVAYQPCASAASDPDGDGWGWEYGRLCTVTKPSAGTVDDGPSGDDGSSSSSSGGSCPNYEGTASTMAALAVSAAMELGRWQPTRDFAIGRVSNSEALVLSATGKARCSDGCANTQGLLDFQKDEASGKVLFPGGVKLDSGALRSRLVAKFRDQLACEMQPSNGGTTNCPVEEHTLTFQRSEKGGCDTNYFFVAKKPDGAPLTYPGQLKNKLLWADRVNPYIGFQNVGEVVSIDPTFGLNERGSVSNGSCSAACVKIGLTDVSNACCSCGGVTRNYRRSAWSSVTYLCQ